MPATDDLIGRVLDGKYKVQRLLGRGGMGEVYAGTHLQLERPVAIKVLHGALVDNESFVARFAREARTAAMLEHPNAVHVYDFGPLADGSAYLVMEFIEGVTLRELVRQSAPFPLHVVLDFLRQAGGAIAAAHARGIVHRDLKPENMMVRSDATGHAVLKVVDFGLAKILENQTSQLTNKSELIGTPRYMAPEQFQGGRVDERVDVYALGCVCFELLTGRTPYEGTFLEVVGKHVYAEIPSFEDLNVRIPAEVADVVRNTLAKDPAARTPSVAEFVRQFEAACGPDVATLASEPMTIHLPASGADTSPQASAFITNIDRTATPAGGDYATRTDGSPEDSVHTLVRTRDQDAPTVVRPEPRPTRAVAGPLGTRATTRASDELEEKPTLPLADIPLPTVSQRFARPVTVAAAIVVLASATLVAFRPWEASPVAPSGAPSTVQPVAAPRPAGGQPAMAPADGSAAPSAPEQPSGPAAPKASASAAKKEKPSAGASGHPDEAAPDEGDVDTPDAADPNVVVIDPRELPLGPRALKKLRRAMKEAEAAQRRAERQHPQPPPPPQP